VEGLEIVWFQRPGQTKVVDQTPQLAVLARSLELTVTCTDRWGDSTTETATP